ncbi:hypothetical protein Tco_1111088, partial [Tanacetum coccineum]
DTSSQPTDNKVCSALSHNELHKNHKASIGGLRVALNPSITYCNQLGYVLWKPSRDFTHQLGQPSGIERLLHIQKCNRDSYERKNELAQDGDFLDFFASLLYSEAQHKGVSCSNSTLPIYSIPLMYNRHNCKTQWGICEVELSLDLFLPLIF